MSSRFLITHYYHSGFSVAAEDMLFVFDYWRGENGELKPDRQITEEYLKSFRRVFVFISHDHIDHYDPIVYTWKDAAPVSYYVSSDMPVGTRGKRMAPGDTADLDEGVTVTAYDSTDLGVSFLLDCRGTRFFHAGDLNFWHWRDESTMKEIEEAEEEFRRAVEPLRNSRIDIAFFPVDPRQGAMFEAGAEYFILSAKPRLLIPMHYFHRADVAEEYARTAGNRSTEVLAMPGYGEQLIAVEDDEGYLNLSRPELPPLPEEAAPEPEPPREDLSELLTENNPFLESDLPIPQLADGGEDADDRPAAPESVQAPPAKDPGLSSTRHVAVKEPDAGTGGGVEN